MGFAKRLRQAMEGAGTITLESKDRLVIMSDLHRGSGNGSDNFSKNQMLFYSALCYYYREGYGYLELGDGDELWENSSLESIRREYPCIFDIMDKFHREDRFFSVYGNHDKKKEGRGKVFPDLSIPEAYWIRWETNRKGFLALHGHQGDTLNDTLDFLACFLVRFIWGPLERIGFQNPAEGSFNKHFRSRQEERFLQWAREKKQPVIIGHTHVERFGIPEKSLYFNCGCGVNNGQITAIELDKGKVLLIKWQVNPDCQGYLRVERIIEKEAHVSEFFR